MIVDSHQGFTLLEMIIYISLSILSLTLLSIAFSGIYGHLMKSITSTNGRLQAHIALQCMAKDILDAHEVVACDDNAIVIQKNGIPKNGITDKAYGWSLKKTTLVRTVGSYDTERKLWRQKTTQPLGYGIQTLSVSFSRQEGSCAKSYARVNLEMKDRTKIMSIMPVMGDLQ